MDTREEKLYQEYLTRPLVDGMVYIIALDEIVVKSSHASFANIRRPRGVELTDIQTAIKKLKRLKKENPHVKLRGLAKCEKRLSELWDEYVEAVKLAKKQFVQLTDMYTEIREIGIHVGACDDLKLKAATDLQWKYSEMYYCSSVTGKVHGIVKDIERTIAALEKNANDDDSEIVYYLHT